MIISFAVSHYLEGIIIFVLITANAIIGYIHSRNSQKAVELIRGRLTINAKVLRDGKWSVIKAKNVVPGDIISVGLGDIVPADAQVISGELSIDQSVLTGESLSVTASQSNIIYSASVVKRGSAKCVVLNTGAHTYFGKTAELVKTAKPKSHQEEIMMTIVKYMMYVGVTASVLVVVYAFFIHVSAIKVVIFVLIFLMGAIPAALPAVITIVQSVGAMELAKKGALVTRLDSIEDAASIDVLCLDKTGTITQNKLVVTDAIPFNDHTQESLIAMAMLASKEEGMDPIDLAIINYGKGKHVGIDGYAQISYTPFNPSIKRAEAVVETKGNHFKVIKGAPQIVIPMCKPMDEKIGKDIDAKIKYFSSKGSRTIAVAKSIDEDEKNLEFMGLLSLSDPPRPEAKQMIAEAKSLGIKPIMLTGDNIAIATEIAKQVGFGDSIIRMPDIGKMSEDEQVKKIEESDGVAEIYPEDKYKIVKLLQLHKKMVGMTGDGVNDAPALKQAEMGIAVSNATDVAKASASVVLTEPGIEVIIDTIKMSRQTYQRMLTWVINKVTKVIEFIGVLTIAFFWLHEVVLSLLGMALLIFANDFVTMSLATDNVRQTSNPNAWNVKNITFASLFIAGILIIEDLTIITIMLKYFHPITLKELTAIVLLSFVFNSQLRVLVVRERRHFWSSMPGKTLFILSMVTIGLFGLLAYYGLLIPSVPLDQILIIFAFSITFAFIVDFPKYYLFRYFRL
jgi:H+-transporting ATPase